jgi:hypothetical protein
LSKKKRPTCRMSYKTPHSLSSFLFSLARCFAESGGPTVLRSRKCVIQTQMSPFRHGIICSYVYICQRNKLASDRAASSTCLIASVRNFRFMGKTVWVSIFSSISRTVLEMKGQPGSFTILFQNLIYVT